MIGTGSPFPPVMRNGKAHIHRPDQQCLYLSRSRFGCARHPCAPGDRFDVHGRGQGAGRDRLPPRAIPRTPCCPRSAACARSPRWLPSRSPDRRSSTAWPRHVTSVSSPPPFAPPCGSLLTSPIGWRDGAQAIRRDALPGAIFDSMAAVRKGRAGQPKRARNTGSTLLGSYGKK